MWIVLVFFPVVVGLLAFLALVRIFIWLAPVLLAVAVVVAAVQH